MDTVLLAEGGALLIVGGLLGYVARHYVTLAKLGSIESDIEEKL